MNCPWCGRSGFAEVNMDLDHDRFWVECVNCQATGPVSDTWAGAKAAFENQPHLVEKPA